MTMSQQNGYTPPRSQVQQGMEPTTGASDVETVDGATRAGPLALAVEMDMPDGVDCRGAACGPDLMKSAVGNHRYSEGHTCWTAEDHRRISGWSSWFLRRTARAHVAEWKQVLCATGSI